MQSKTNTFNLALTGMLIAVGIVIRCSLRSKSFWNRLPLPWQATLPSLLLCLFRLQWRLPFLWEPPLDFSWQASR